ncbi:tetratricopeptide repeat protein [Alphaproteobacteria bacterium]|nr:tetratricopeptide repeat protein [Alphaproteobacteria bacterium]
MKFFKPIFLICCLFFNSSAADQLDPKLIELFDKLYIAQSNKEINSLTQDIWKIWDETNDSKIEADYYRGLEAMRMGNYVMSIAFFTRVIEKNPDFAEGWNKRATVYYILGQFDKSMIDINKTLLLEPRHFGAMDGMGLIFIQLQQYDKAIKIYDQMLKIFPHSADTEEKKKLMQEYISQST